MTRAEDTYEEIARMFLDEISDDAARLMERKMEESWRRISQLIVQRYASLYYNELSRHISRIEVTTMDKDESKGDKELTDTVDGARNQIQMGCSKQLSDERMLIGDRTRRHIRMGRLEKVLL